MEIVTSNYYLNSNILNYFYYSKSCRFLLLLKSNNKNSIISIFIVLYFAQYYKDIYIKNSLFS